MPGFFVLGVFGVLAVGGEGDVGLVVGGGEGEDVEGVGGDVVDAVVVEVAFVGVSAMEDGAFDLDAEEVALVVYGEVVGGVVSAGLGEDQAVFGGSELETEFGPFSAEFGVRDVWAAGAIGHGGPWGETSSFYSFGAWRTTLCGRAIRPPGLKPV